METDEITTKVCSRCGKELPITEFYEHKRSKDGFASMCKACHKQSIEASVAKKKKLESIVKQGGKQLKDYTPRELMEELYRRGYRGTLEYVEKHVINFDDLDK